MNALTFDYHDQPMAINSNMPHMPVNIQCRLYNAQKPRTVEQIMAALEASENREREILKSIRDDVQNLARLIQPLVGV